MLGRFISATLFCGAFLVLTVEDASSASKTISKPMFNGNRLDWCLKWSTDCGKPAADAYCQSQGFQQAVEFVPDPRIGARAPTRLIGSGAICDLKHCDGFAQITCEKMPIAPAAMSRGTSETLRNTNLVQKASLIAPLPPEKPIKIAANPIPPATPGVLPPMRKGEAYRIASASPDSFDTSAPSSRTNSESKPMKLASAATRPEPPKPAAAKTVVEPRKDSDTKTSADSKPVADTRVAMVMEAKPADESKAVEDKEEVSAKPKTDPVMTASVTAPATPIWTPAPKQFDKPMYNGKRLDWCMGWDKECGQVAADAFCKTNGFSKATTFNQDPHIGDVEPTRVMANGAVCDQALCNGFKDITCTM